MPCSFKVQQKNEFEQLYNEEKQTNARLMKEINQFSNTIYTVIFAYVT